MSRLTVKLGKLVLPNPVMLASGILSHGSLLEKALREGAGAVVTKSLTLKGRKGYETPVVVGVEEGLVNAVGLANPGYKDFLKNDLQMIKEKNRVIVSIAGDGPDEFVKIASSAEDAGIAAVELNLSCPHVKKHGLEIGKDPKLVRRIVKDTRGVLKIPVHVKMGFCDELIRSSLVAEDAGADAVVAINTLPAMVIDVYSRKPILSRICGGLSGPAIHPIALRCVYELYRELSIPVIGCGGVKDWQTATEFLLAGAKAVQVGSAVAIKGLKVFSEITEGLAKYLKEYGFESVDILMGSLEGKK